MKHSVVVFVGLLIGTWGTDAYGQPASVTWNLTAPDSIHVSLISGNISSPDQSLTNLAVPASGGYSSSSAQRTSAKSGGVDGTWPGDAGEAVDRYMQFAVSPTSTNDFFVNAVSLYLWVNSGSNMRANVYYSTDPTFTTRTQIGTTFTLGTTTPGAPNVTSNPSLTVTNGQTFYVRVYPWYTTSTTGKYVVTKIVTIAGTTSTSGASITPSTNSLSGFTQTVGVPSTTQSYTVSGTGLSADVVVTPPVGFEISSNGGSTWGNNSSPITLPVSGGVIAGQPVNIIVRLNAGSGGAFSGDITHTSTGVTTATVAVSGFALASEPTTQSSITFGTVTGSSIVVNFSGGNGGHRIVATRSSAAVSFAPTDGNAVAGVSSNFPNATDQGSGNRVVYDGTGNSVTVTGLSQNTMYHFAVYEYNVGSGNSQNYNTTSPGTGNQATLAVPTIAVNPGLLSFGGVEINTVSPEQTYSLSGGSLSPSSGNITVTAPTGYEVSATSGSGFSTSILVAYSSGTLSPTTIYARFLPTTLTTYSGNILHTGGGAPAESVAVSGTGVPPTQPNVFEAENGILTSAYVTSQYAGYSGTGYVDIADKTGAALEVDFRRASANTDTMRVYFANGGSSRAYAVTVNGASVGSLTFPGTGSWTTWSSVMMLTPFQAGVNRVRFASTTNGGNANIDRVYIGGQAATPVFKLNLTKSGIGTVGAVPASADSFYDAGTAVTVTATPSGGSSFYRWSGTSQSSTNPHIVVMNSHQTEIGVMPLDPGFGAFPFEAAPKGFASVGAFTYPNGTTGGTGPGSQTVYITSSDDLGSLLLRRVDPTHALNFPPLMIYIIGTLTPGSVVTDMCDVKDVYDISIIGVGVDATLSGFGLNVVRAKNIIVRNLRIQNSPVDGITVQADDVDGTGNHLWFDHNTITNCYDGALDVTHTASYVTVSWNHFYNHNKLCLMGHSDSQTSDVTMKVTYHHNYFDSTEQRHPRVRYGKAHVYNNYYRKIGLYGISSNDGADVLVEGNYFFTVPLPMDTSRDGSIPGDVLERNNVFINCGTYQTRGTAFEASSYYGYSVDDPGTLLTLLPAYSGSGRWDFSNNGIENPAVPGIPTLALPPHGTTGAALSQTLVWRANFNTTGYRVQLGLDSSFVSSVLLDSSLTDTSCNISGLQFLTTYFWRVKGTNAVGAGSFSLPWKFRTAAAPQAGFSGSPNPLNFGNVVVGGSLVDSISVTNTGSVSLAIDSIRTSSGIFSVNPSGSVVIGPGNTSKVGVTFSPSSLGVQSDNVVFYDNAPSSPHSIAVSGTGVSSSVNVNVPISSGWNMISNPVTAPVPDDSARHLFPTILSRVFEFNSGYIPGDVMTNGKGYWGKFPAPTTSSITGTPRTNDSLNVVPMWNLVGSISTLVDTGTIVSVPPGLRSSNWFGWSGAGYIIVTQIVPGGAYWVKSSGVGKFILTSPVSGAARKSGTVESTLDNLNALTIKDSRGGMQILYFGADIENRVDESMFAMPPLPPEGSFDARFETVSGGSMVKMHATTIATGIEFPVAIRSDAYPLTVSWKMTNGASTYALTDGLGERAFRSKEMSGEGSMKIANGEVNRIAIRVTGALQQPLGFSLLQNYPNPFNPSTEIKFSVAQSERTMLHLYNILGQKVATLFDGVAESGRYYTVTLDASEMASGMYFYSLQNGKSFEMKKMMLVK